MKIDGPLNSQPTPHNPNGVQSRDASKGKKLENSGSVASSAHSDSIEGLKTQLQEHPEVRESKVSEGRERVRQGHAVNADDAEQIADSILKELGI